MEYRHKNFIKIISHVCYGNAKLPNSIIEIMKRKSVEQSFERIWELAEDVEFSLLHESQSWRSQITKYA